MLTFAWTGEHSQEELDRWGWSHHSLWEVVGTRIGSVESLPQNAAVLAVLVLLAALVSHKIRRTHRGIVVGLCFLAIQLLLANVEIRHWHDCMLNLKNIGTAGEMYSTDNTGIYPRRLSDMVPRYLPSLPVCPSAGYSTYSWKGHAKLSWTIYCAGTHHALIGVPRDRPVYAPMNDMP